MKRSELYRLVWEVPVVIFALRFGISDEAICTTFILLPVIADAAYRGNRGDIIVLHSSANGGRDNDLLH